MGRIGIKTKEEAYAVIEEVANFSSEFEISGIFTHFATADSFRFVVLPTATRSFL